MSSDQDPPPPKTAPYTIGYKKPPIATRFQPGNRAAARRRPRRETHDEIFRRVMAEPVRLTSGGRSTSVTSHEAVIRSQRQRALNGDRHATEQILKRCERLGVSTPTDTRTRADYAAEVRAMLANVAANLKANGANDDPSS